MKDSEGQAFQLEPPKPAPEVPPHGFDPGESGFVAPPDNGEGVELVLDPDSNRLQSLAPWPEWDGNDFVDLPVLVKAQGKCTTDHISPAGPWLRFRGHLDNLSDNMFLGADNAFTEEPGSGKNQLSGQEIQPIPAVARAYKAQGLRWIAVGDHNYGEGSSREHAAMSPKLLGAAAIITRSFARIHESNLKKQGLLPFTFADPDDYEKVLVDDRISLLGLADLAPGKSVRCLLNHAGGSQDSFDLEHTFNETQIQWFKAGSAMNHMKNLEQQGGESP